MVAAHKLPEILSPQEYLERERQAAFKSEYLHGRIVAMAGASPMHNRITENLSGELYVQLKSKPCQAFSRDLRVKVTASSAYLYPDIVVVCEPPRYVDTGLETLTNPSVLMEVLSDSTEALDRGEKFALYGQIPELTDYVLISQREPRVEHFARQSDHQWLLTVYTSLSDHLPLPALDCTLRLTDIYDRVDFPAPPVPAVFSPESQPTS